MGRRSFRPGRCDWPFLIGAGLVLFGFWFGAGMDGYSLPVLILFLFLLSVILTWIVAAFVKAFGKSRSDWIQHGLMNIALLLCVLAVAVATYPARVEHRSSPGLACTRNLKQIGYALTLYGGDYEGYLPPQNGVEGLRKLVETGILTDLECYICPVVSKKVPKELTEENCDYWYIGGLCFGEGSADMPVARDKKPVHGGYHVLYGGGHVNTEKEDELK